MPHSSNVAFLVSKINISHQQTISQPLLLAVHVSFFFHKFLLCSSGNQAAKHVGLPIQYYSSFVPSAAQHRGVTLGQIHKGAPSFHLRAAVSLPASPPPLSSSYLCSAAHCTMYRATGMRLNAWHPQPVFFWAASAQQHSPAQQQGWLQQHTLPELPNSVQMGRAR